MKKTQSIEFGLSEGCGGEKDGRGPGKGKRTVLGEARGGKRLPMGSQGVGSNHTKKISYYGRSD